MPLFSCFTGSARQTPQDTVHLGAAPQNPGANGDTYKVTEQDRCIPTATAAPSPPGTGGGRQWYDEMYIPFVHLLATLNGGWWSLLSEACQATCEHLGADHVCVFVLSCSDLWATAAACSGAGEAATVGRAYSCDPRFNGSAAAVILRQIRETGVEHSVAFRSAVPPPTPVSSGEMARAGNRAIPSSSTARSMPASSSDDLPGDWQVLFEEYGCRHFAAVPLGNAEGEVVGVLSVASKAPVRPPTWTPEALHSIVGLLARSIRRAQTVLASPALSQLHAAATFRDMVQAVAEAATDVAATVAYVRGSSRVAVIQADMRTAAIFQQQHSSQDGDVLASVPLLKARRSSCEFVLMPMALRKSITTNTFSRASTDGLPAPADGLKRDSWGTHRNLTSLQAIAQANASFTLSFPRGAPCKGHTLGLDKTLLGEALSKQVAGLCIDDCQAYTVSTKAYPRDLILSRGAVMPMSLALAAIAVDGKPLMALYVTFATTLPRPMLQAVVQELQQLLQAILPTIRAKFAGILKGEYELLARQLEGAASRRGCPAVDTTPRGQSTAQLGPHSPDDAPLSDGSITVEANATGTPGPDPTNEVASFVLSKDGSPAANRTADGAGPVGARAMSAAGGVVGQSDDDGGPAMVDRASPMCAPPTPTSCASARFSNAAGAGGGAAEEPTTPSPTRSARDQAQPAPMVAAEGNATAGKAGAAAAAAAAVAAAGGGGGVAGIGNAGGMGPRWPSPSALAQGRQGSPARPAAAASALPAESAVTAAAGAGRDDAAAFLGDMEMVGAGGGGRRAGTEGTTRKVGGLAVGEVALQPERCQSACEPGMPGPRRVLHSLRSVSFHLERAQPPRGASKLAPIIASVHDRLKAAQSLQMTLGRSESRKADLRSVKLLQEIGQGGYGTVYRGTYHGAEVAVKLIKQSRLAAVASSSNALGSHSAGLGLHKQHLHDAIELVASVSMSHINIVQVPAYFMDVKLEKPDEFNPLDSVDQPTESRPFRLLHSPSLIESPAPGQDGIGLGEGAMALVLEYCDCGSLCDAIMGRRFIEKVTPKSGPNGVVGKTYLAMNMRSVYSTLLEIALALRHMHSLALVHCDLKPQNVLLKSTPRDPRGFTAKLSDFGLAKMMAHDDAGQLVIDDAVASGTITHVAPEVLLGESGLGAAVDIYAFGILMFQVLCGMKVYDKSMTPSGIANAVAHRAMRPQMPSWAPASYSVLATKCWSQDPADRPTADALVRQLEAILESKKNPGRFQSHQQQQQQQQPQQQQLQPQRPAMPGQSHTPSRLGAAAAVGPA